MTKRWTLRPEGSNWGDFGEDDQLGSLNYITTESVLRGVCEAREGRSFCLSLPLDYPGGRVLAPHRFPFSLKSTERKGRPYFNYSFRHEGPRYLDVCCDDTVTLCTQYSTQWDSLAHVGSQFDLHGDGVLQPCFYNGFVGGRDIVPPEARGEGWAMSLGIDTMACKAIQTRGVLLDLDRHFGRAQRLVGFRDLRQVLDHDRIEIRPGDIVCLHTGFADELLKMQGRPDPSRVHAICGALDGTDEALLGWLSDSKIAALVADNYAVEHIANDPNSTATRYVPLHHHCLFKRGMPLGELWHLTELALWLRERNRSHFLLTAPPLRLTGAVGSPVTPVALV